MTRQMNDRADGRMNRWMTEQMDEMMFQDVLYYIINNLLPKTSETP
jgi:hypothetical protein